MADTAILVLNGPNLNLMGDREPAIYGSTTLAEIEARCEKTAAPLGIAVDFRQSNAEGQLIDWLHEARGVSKGLIINAGGLSHTSIALMDAVAAFGAPVIEVHLSNIHRREAFRRHSYIAEVAQGSIVGLGAQGYELAVAALARLIRERQA